MMINEVISKPAASLINIVCAFGNYDKVEVMAKCLTKSNRRVNITTVENVLQEIQDNYDKK